jgi:hypothetical protein
VKFLTKDLITMKFNAAWFIVIFYGFIPPLASQPDNVKISKTENLSTVHKFKNAFFEDIVFGFEEGIPNWIDCGKLVFKDESPPTVYLGLKIYNLKHVPQDKNQYISMVTRDYDTWESISQRLDNTLIPSHKYKFSVFLAKADLKSTIRNSRYQSISFNNHVVLRV